MKIKQREESILSHSAWSKKLLCTLHFMFYFIVKEDATFPFILSLLQQVAFAWWCWIIGILTCFTESISCIFLIHLGTVSSILEPSAGRARGAMECTPPLPRAAAAKGARPRLSTLRAGSKQWPCKGQLQGEETHLGERVFSSCAFCKSRGWWCCWSSPQCCRAQRFLQCCHPSAQSLGRSWKRTKFCSCSHKWDHFLLFQ